MPGHSNPDDLALLALGEQVDDPHASSCSVCQREIEALRAVVTAARSVTPEDRPEAPPPSVWAAIADELELADPDGGQVPAVTEADPASQAADPAEVDELARRRRSGGRRTLVLTAAAALLGVAVGAAGAVLVSGSDDQPGGVVASAELAALPDRQGTGEATVRGSGAQRVLVLDVSGLSAGDGVYEVWLLDADAKRLVSLGLLEGTSGRFALPPSVDVGDFPVVDVSIEPLDGDPAHSGDSVVRGTLRS